MSKHNWTYEENEICCRRYLENYVLRNSGLSMSTFAKRLKQEMPQLKETSIKNKISNIRYLSLNAGLADSMCCAPLANCSADNVAAFNALLREFHLL